jgi:hypothetical protein
MQSIVMKPLSAWQRVISQPRFLVILFLGYLSTLAITHFSPIILGVVQARQGVILHDYLLEIIPPTDCSNLIFLVLYLQIAWMVLRSFQFPALHVQFIWSFLLFYTFRFITIWFTPLEPPAGIINLQDPFARIFIYDHAIINKDLFFSGHVGFAFAIYLLLPNKFEKWLGLIVVFLVAIFVLAQHIHYTIDVLVAPFFGYFSYWLAKRIAVYANGE